MSLKIGSTHMIIRYWPSGVLNWLFIYFLRTTFSFIIVFTFVSYLTGMIFSLFFRIHVLNTIVVLIPKSISLSSVTVFSSLSCIIIERIIRFSSSGFLSFLELSRFSIRRRLREWPSFVWLYKIVWYGSFFRT